MKLIIQIPCYNEEQTLHVAVSALPRTVAGFDTVEWLVIDDGSSDSTSAEARRLGVDHLVRHPENRGLASAFSTGIAACLALGADVIVNTDADNQYDASCIPALTAPVLAGTAEIVIGARPIEAIAHFSPIKKLLQRLGSWVVRLASGTAVPDAPSGFRAFSRKTAQRLVVFSKYTYTLETIIQAGQKGMAVTFIPVRVNPELRKSKLVRSNASYVWRSLVTIVRIFAIYRPFRFFLSIGLSLLGVSAVIGIRFLVKYAVGEGEGHVQSLILMAILAGMGFQTVLIAFVADLLAANRRLLEDQRYLLTAAAPSGGSSKHD